MNTRLSAAVLTAALLLGAGSAFAKDQKPKANASSKKHPNITAAQRLTSQAYNKLVAAQKANEYDMGGHAQKAKDLLEQANQEIKLAASAVNQNSPGAH